MHALLLALRAADDAPTLLMRVYLAAGSRLLLECSAGVQVVPLQLHTWQSCLHGSHSHGLGMKTAAMNLKCNYSHKIVMMLASC